MSALAAALTYAALVTLALAMNHHARAVFKSELTVGRKTSLRLAGWILLTLSLVATFIAHGREMGLVSWIATLAVSGFALTLLLTYAPRFCAIPLAGLLILTAFF